jgi:hypothetical protein
VADGYRGAVAWCQVGATPTTFPDLVLEPRPVDAAPPPNQHVLVVDPSGSPVADAPVYQHHAYGSAMGRTDQEGRVWFGSTRTDAGWDRDACGYCAIDPRGVFAAAFVPSAPRTAELLTLRLLTSRRVEVAIERPAGIVAEPTVSWQAVAPAIGTGWLRADADGRYRFAPPPFAAALVVQCDGCRTHEGAPQEAAAWAEHATVVLARQSAGTSVRGKVLAAGRALPAARVQVLAHKAPLLVDGFRRGEWRPETGAGVATGADGTFTLRRDDGGELRLLARADGFAPAVTDVLALAADTGIEAPPLELGRGGTLRGRARLASGSPAARRVVAVNSELFGARTTVTARDGAFTFEHLAPGGYELRPCDRDLDAGHAEQSLDADAAARLCAVDVTIADGATTACELVVDGYALELQLVAAAGEGSFAGWTATLRTPHDAQRVAGPVRVGSDGRATLCSHRGGEHVLQLDAPGGPFGAVRVTAPVELGAAPLQRRIELDLVPWRSADALPPGSDRLWLGAQTAGLRIGCPLALDAAGHATAALAPVGAADLRADGKVIATVVVRRP